MEPINLAEFKAAARARLSKMAYDYYASGAHDEITLRRNRSAYGDITIPYRVLRDVASRRMDTALLGQPVSMPILVSPTAFHGMAHSDAELATARAVAKAGTIMMLSGLANTDVEDVVAAADGRVWFQLYVYKDRGATEALIRRVEQAGARALVLTVDAAVWGCREADVRNGFRLPPGLSVQNMSAQGMGDFPADVVGSGLKAYVTERLDPTLCWRDLEWLASTTSLPILLKGIVHPEDARLATEAGVAGIVVSNHGGRQLDTSPATIDALPAIAEVVDGRIDVLIDGGVRRGTDVFKALALGAKAVGLGRPILWGLAVDGEAGVTRVLELMREELDLAMALAGCNSPSDVTRDCVTLPRLTA